MTDSTPAPETPPVAPTPVVPRGLPNWHPAYLIATVFGVGHLPKAPGTWASLIALPFAFGIHYLGGLPVLLLFVLYFFGIGWWAAHVYVKRRMVKDPGEIVIDEVVGQMAVFLVFMNSTPDWYDIILGFLLFRIFDIWKPWPVSWADGHVHGGFGVLFDDILAAIYAGGILWVINSIIVFNMAPNMVSP
jgi:phosphatidylglycerophosphatase A